jgi:hypothetical protein
MSRAARRSALAALVLLLLLGILWPRDNREYSATSFGNVPSGFKALYSLLAELGLPVHRSYVPTGELPARGTVWWLDAPSLCSAPPAEARPDAPRKAPPSREDALDAFAPIDPEAWIRAGGTAVVFLPDRKGACGTKARLAGVMLPRRSAPPEDEAAALGPFVVPPHGAATQRLTGALFAHSRRLETDGLASFESDPAAPPGAAAWRVVARLDGHPFAVERRLGTGRLVLVADGSFLTNRWLDQGDAAPAALDLVRAYGPPRIDELSHGFGPARSGLAYLLRSAALPFLLGFALLGAAYAWRGAALPPRRVAEVDPSAPTLVTFVDSLAELYARTGDHGRVFERYRELSAGLLRRHFGMPPETPKEKLVARLAGRRGIGSEGLRLLAEGAPVRTRGDLERAVAVLDRMMSEATS